MSVRGRGVWFQIREGGHSWELITEGRASKVGVGCWACL